MELIEKLNAVATDLRCREAPLPPTPQFALIYGKEGKTREGRERSPSRGENGTRKDKEYKKPIELTDSDDLELPLPPKKLSGSISPIPESPQKAPKRQLGEPKEKETQSPVYSENEFNKYPFEDGSRSPSPDPPLSEPPTKLASQKKPNYNLHVSGSVSTIAVPNDIPTIAEESDEDNEEKPEKGPLPDLRLPHLKYKPQMPAINVPPVIMSPLSQTPPSIQTPSVCVGEERKREACSNPPHFFSISPLNRHIHRRSNLS
jgi:hypothetical protein